MRALPARLGYGSAELESRVTLVDRATGALALVGPVEGASAYLAARFAEAPSRPPDDDRCALVLLPAHGRVPPPDEVGAALQLLPP
jgi:hypothetical protein